MGLAFTYQAIYISSLTKLIQPLYCLVLNMYVVATDVLIHLEIWRFESCCCAVLDIAKDGGDEVSISCSFTVYPLLVFPGKSFHRAHMRLLVQMVLGTVSCGFQSIRIDLDLLRPSISHKPRLINHNQPRNRGTAKRRNNP